VSNKSRCIQIAGTIGVLLATGGASAAAQANKYTVCKDGTTWMERGRGACGGHGGVDPKRSAAANRSLSPTWPRDIEIARRREFERRMIEDIRLQRERQRIYESNGAIGSNKDLRKANAKGVGKTNKGRKP
jgi:hypothetical protein